MSDLLEHIQNKFLEDLSDAHGQGLLVHALAEVACAHQFNELPGACNQQTSPHSIRSPSPPSAFSGSTRSKEMNRSLKPSNPTENCCQDLPHLFSNDDEWE
ncbi:hypothetical protein EYF80_003074 [Liparis tanakae]|uniref:Uncharacterized protein n=1 Tax=Liparis tanakae TaxID=230148 RepID=A0A4Z2J8R3_9TELE|nr:hypothetical protein EYF80_003074 [Liparis tanakae]